MRARARARARVRVRDRVALSKQPLAADVDSSAWYQSAACVVSSKWSVVSGQ